MRAAARQIPRLVPLAALLAIPFVVRAQPQAAVVVFDAPAATPEAVAEDQDFPFLSRLPGTTLLETTRIAEPLEVKPASAESEAMLAGLSFVEKSYSAPLNVWDLGFVALYRDALIARGWRMLDQPPAIAAESEPHVITLSAHYAAHSRDIYVRIARAPGGAYQIGVADVGAEDWSAVLDHTCHVALFSVHFSRDSSMSYEDTRPTLEKVAALLESRPELRIEVQGHTDNVGEDKELIALSSRRAAIVHAALITLGAPRQNVSARGYGKARPIAPNDTDWGRTRNRRIEIAKKNCGPPSSTPPRTPPRPGV